MSKDKDELLRKLGLEAGKREAEIKALKARVRILESQVEGFKKRDDTLNGAILKARGALLLSGIREGHPEYEQIDKAYHALAVAQG